MLTCTVKASCYDRNGKIAERSWSGVDIMKVAFTRGWCTRQMNKHLHDGVRVEWECKYDQDAMRFDGYMVRIQGYIMKRGIFEY